MKEKRYARLVLILLLCAQSMSAALAQQPAGPGFLTVPNVLRPGRYYDIVVQAPAPDMAELALLDRAGNVAYTILSDYPLSQGANALSWDGMRLNERPMEEGEYTLRLTAGGLAPADAPLRVGAPYPLLTNLAQSDYVFAQGGAAIDITFTASEAGLLTVTLRRYADDTVTPVASVPVDAGAGRFSWDGLADNARVPEGEYTLSLTLSVSGGMESMPHELYVRVEAPALAPTPAQDAPTLIVDETPAPTPLPTPMPTPSPLPLSAPYSDSADGSFWSMTPGELDDQAIWDILMQPIVVYDGGIKAGTKSHAYLMENPDGTGKKVAQLHTQSQGVHVLGEPNADGYVLVEAFSNYDPAFQPKTDDERAHAFEVKRGYVLAKNLKTVEVMPDMALLIDKLTQRMYLFIDGKRVTELLISTGKIADNKYYNETIAGEYITVSHTGLFQSGNMFCDMAIRINGGILIHEVPHKLNGDGTRNYSAFEGYLGTKQSHGCVRVQRLKNDDGYNHRWIWQNFKSAKPYKVIIWDDINRVDTPAVWYPNPKN